ncbi:unnamed protein product [Acanthoscelides obtectus]|uniref:HTH psq-type domain-containing protein n=1 Tax=Acanthoscelides obtectus TaxID=200917 RepID=A0A9P0KXJ9_ACAOB|nr:unnamed protein product [Acanthoscelides obtectus]CAK1668733.1 hypothetical protein AOBTE_LOCUS26569 [Acanthoscelides obtectus]
MAQLCNKLQLAEKEGEKKEKKKALNQNEKLTSTLQQPEQYMGSLLRHVIIITHKTQRQEQTSCSRRTSEGSLIYRRMLEERRQPLLNYVGMDCHESRGHQTSRHDILEDIACQDGMDKKAFLTMARYKCKGLRSNWADANMKLALAAVRSRKMKIYTASKHYNVPRRTLIRYLQENKETKSTLGRKPLLNPEDEKILESLWDKAATPANVKAGFEATGIFPFNPDRILEEVYAPSIPTHNFAEPGASPSENQENGDTNDSDATNLLIPPQENEDTNESDVTDASGNSPYPLPNEDKGNSNPSNAKQSVVLQLQTTPLMIIHSTQIKKIYRTL